MVLSKKQITKALISLRRCAGWSAPLVFASPEDRFSRVEAHMISTVQSHYNTLFGVHRSESYYIGTISWSFSNNFFVKFQGKMAAFYPNLCYNGMCYKGTAL